MHNYRKRKLEGNISVIENDGKILSLVKQYNPESGLEVNQFAEVINEDALVFERDALKERIKDIEALITDVGVIKKSLPKKVKN